MSGFIAGSAVEKLDYDFTGAQQVGGKGQCTGKGVVPEPTQDRLERFLQFIADGAKDRTDAAERDDASVGYAESLTKLRGAIADFCAGSPTAEELDELPPRLVTAFFRWLIGEFLPKA